MKKPYLKLRRCIEDADLNFKELCTQTGIPRSTLNERINAPESDGAWRWGEIVIICRTLHIPPEKIGEYFFPRLTKEDKTA